MSMSISRGRAPPPSISTKTQNVSILNRTKKYKPQGHHLSVDKNIIDELLLVCGVIGSTEDPTSQKIVPVEDCLNWLQDLQRALRRDEDAYRPISLLLGQWKVVQQKLLPLVLSCRYDTPLVTTIVKILVILTKPLSETARNAGRLIIDTKSKKVEDA
jgi:timeless